MMARVRYLDGLKVKWTPPCLNFQQMMLGQKRLMEVRQKNTYNNMTTVLEF